VKYTYVQEAGQEFRDKNNIRNTSNDVKIFSNRGRGLNVGSDTLGVLFTKGRECASGSYAGEHRRCSDLAPCM